MQLGYVINYVKDVASSVAFYREAFGLAPRFVAETGDYAELATGATTLSFASVELARSNGLALTPSSHFAPGGATEIAFVTDEVRSAYDRALRAGASGVRAPSQMPWGQTVAWLRDADGALVELCSPMAPRAG